QNLKARNLRLAVWPPRRRRYYRFEYWKRFLAPFCPYFLRSFLRESRLIRPSDFSFLRSSELNCSNARAIPSFTASACPATPPPETLAITVKVFTVSLEISGWRALERCDSVTKYWSKGRPLTLKSPVPGRRKTRAIADLRRPRSPIQVCARNVCSIPRYASRRDIRCNADKPSVRPSCR